MKKTDDRLPVKKIEGEPAYVGISAGMTVPTRPYESARIHISLTYPCNLKDTDEVFEKCKNWVDVRLAEEIAEIRESAPKVEDI